MCENHDFKRAADSAVALQLFDAFPPPLFCLPLLILDKPCTMYSYLDCSPKAQTLFVSFLDYLTEDNAMKVSHLLATYQKLKPLGANKLLVKPLENMVKKLSEKYKLPPETYPLTHARKASHDLYYWVRTMFGPDPSNMSLVNWRELIERKVTDNPVLREQLVNNLLSFDVREAKVWANKFGRELDGLITEESDEESWEPEVNLNEDTFYRLPIKENNIIFVDTIEGFEGFICDVFTRDALGIDAEFSSGRGVQQLSLVQASFCHRFIFLHKLFDRWPQTIKYIF